MAQILSHAESTLYTPADVVNESSSHGGVDMAGTLSTETSIFHQSRFLVIFLIIVSAVLAKVFGSSKQKLPAGVRPLPRQFSLPYAGRFWDVPGPGIEAAWHFGALHKKLGPIYQWKVMGITHIWIETDKISKELFVTRQRNYCDRNELPAAIGVREGSEILPLMAYGEQFRRYKNFMHLIMRHANPRSFYDWPADENKRTLRRLLENPNRWSEHMLVHCARTISGIAWGNPNHGSKLLTIIPTILKGVSPAGPLINKLTFLSNLPESISPWKQAEAIRKKEMTDAFTEALQDAQKKSSEGRLEGCWSKLWLESEKGTEHLDSYEAAHAIGSSSFVAIATVGGPCHAFFTAMCHYPSWQTRVQAEIDRVCPDRPPEICDMPRLPMLRATIKETLRWRQATPLGVPHIAIEDDIYEGYHIPKGAICHANHYLISREESTYPEGNQFKPERFLDPKYPTYKEPLSEFPNLREDRSFGYGNRSCPGVDLVHTELFGLIGSLLWAFEIRRPEGNTTPVPWYETAPWVITMSKPFKCDVLVRSEAKRQWILNETPEGGGLIIDSERERTDRWQVMRKPGEDLFEWDGLTEQASVAHKQYPPGA